MDRWELIAFIILTVGILIDIDLTFFSIMAIVSLIIIWRKVRRDVIYLFLLAALIGFLFEKLGITTGIPFGRYQYNFPHYFLGVPIFVIMGWAIFSFISYLPIMYFPRTIKIALFPIMMVTIDLSVDPIMVTAGFWKWEYSFMDWHGIPLTNFIGWYIVSLVIIVAFLTLFHEDIKAKKAKANLFTIDYFLFSLNFLIYAKPQLLIPLLVGTLVSLSLTLLIFLL